MLSLSHAGKKSNYCFSFVIAELFSLSLTFTTFCTSLHNYLLRFNSLSVNKILHLLSFLSYSFEVFILSPYFLFIETISCWWHNRYTHENTDIETTWEVVFFPQTIAYCSSCRSLAYFFSFGILNCLHIFAVIVEKWSFLPSLFLHLSNNFVTVCWIFQQDIFTSANIHV